MAAVATLRGRGLSAFAAATYLHPKVERQVASAWHPHHERSRHAQALTICLALRSHCGDYGGRKLSYGFRKRRSCADAIEGCFAALKHRNPSWALEGDIRGCFDNISHAWLMAHVPMNKTILHKWLKSGYMENHSFYATEQRYATGWHHLTCTGEPCARRSRTASAGEIPAAREGIVARTCCGCSFNPLCRRLHHYWCLERATGE